MISVSDFKNWMENLSRIVSQRSLLEKKVWHGQGKAANKSRPRQAPEVILKPASKQLWFLQIISMNRRLILESEMYF